MSARSSAFVSAIFAVGALAATVFASGELRDGFAEIPDHWWSTFMVGVPFAGAMGTAWLAWRRR